MAVDFSARTGVTLEFLAGFDTVQVNQGNAETLLVMLELWFRHHLDAPNPQPPSPNIHSLSRV